MLDEMTGKPSEKIILVVPAFNEEENIAPFVEEAKKHLGAFNWGILFVNDGSRDGTWKQILAQSQVNPNIHGICLARNFGHQNAIKAGLEAAVHFPADAYITLDADLQHPISLIPEMVEQWKKGVHIVQSQRQDAGRPISLVKKHTSRLFYAVFSWLSNVPIQPGMSDFRLIDRSTLEFVNNCEDKDFFLRGMLPWSGLSTVVMPYAPAERIHGSSKFTMKKMCDLALSGIVGYSTRPLHLAIVIGLIAITLAFLYFLYVIVVVCIGIDVSLGWPSVIACILGLGGIQLFILGIMGIYLGKLFMEHKSRPTYVIAERTFGQAR